MQQLVAGLQGHAHQDTPLAKAQALVYRAFEEPDEQKRIQLAKDALAISPDCADAYVLLAEPATSGASSKPGRTCVPGWGWPMPSGPLAVVTRPYGTCRTCSG